MRHHRLITALALTASAAVLASCGTAGDGAAPSTSPASSSARAGFTVPGVGDLPPANPDQVHLFAFNDFHGNLQPPTGSTGKIGGTEAGGAVYFATALQRLKQAYPNNLTVAAGDLVSASPLVSALFRDEPTVKFLNSAGVQASSVGNHEFDHGTIELERLQKGGCAPDGCEPGEPFTGAAYQYLAANVTNEAGQLPPGTVPWKMFEVSGRKIAVIGTVTPETATIVAPEGVRGYTFGDEAEAINRYVPEMKAAGAQAIVATMHDGGAQKGSGEADPNACNNVSAPTPDLAAKVDPAVTALVTGHSHQAYVCTIGGRTVTQAASYGRLITDITLDFGADRVTSKAVNRLVGRDLPPDAATQRLVEFYEQEAKPRADRVIGTIPADLNRAPFPGGDSALGDVIADAMLFTTRAPNPAAGVIAFMNPGGVRADLKAGDVTYGAAYTVQPFGNQVVTVSLTGQQIIDLLEQQWQNPDKTTILAPSGISYTYDPNGASNRKVLRDSVKVGDQPLNPVAVYRVTTNNFLAAGGDGFSVFTRSTDLTVGGIDLDALEKYLQATENLRTPTSRITKQ
ncbi:5'-Nucleotidase domain protein OS=Tsukamurella paurometabola (strain ATCC 8368 / DSM / CCUG 35730 / CIP 100753 / JCM 10117 / KCTC 9821 / NBRC 16120 / NCIMB 702349 / NCTC 13040) OX=521096 GN=Tpau_2145 PE=3 SV=1 [Tsukamurella paurometabola]|uniref:5'-Nucleotidase domain protein n=1 Tax=Tsukamurella paurometabola (strain ATCC 8368 / DSM 20162 / CCUG 35730 / CIP 100753 / JCM 10117 / KCTC 9821 / NBRC 16120 / NCIMB 702349 / NCTC 13040) TaxID=521096 RepID=D5UPK0_TSUPD|nr:bifunctional metallophosphatase/5'-nucleotidase [Tsukamurella paurometabola]ADG78756.1 5'-Nucleotidase domain protein [Tsukamurella paurometabola DSM 20162]SUP33039.1 Endonuclease YhcR precursor [Tsukamurella paurometabola]